MMHLFLECRPGVGKTTVIREIARVLSDELHKRVVRNPGELLLYCRCCS